MQLILGKAKRKDRQEKRCFFCGTPFSFERGENIVCVNGEDWLCGLAERHVCRDCARLDDDGLARRLREAAGHHRGEAAKHRKQAEEAEALAQRLDDLEVSDIERVWRTDIF